jgi:small ligand-binding sensory domain FIST
MLEGRRVRWTSALSIEGELEAAVEEAAVVLQAALEGERPDLVVVFASPHHSSAYERLPALVRGALGAGLVIGCSAGGVIGAGTEVENRAGLSVTAAVLPDVNLSPFQAQNESVPAPLATQRTWEELVRVGVDQSPHFVLLADPFSFDAEGFLTGLDAAFPASKKIGGLASGARAPGGNALFLGAGVYRAGIVGVGLHGNVEVDTVVAQGCRPIGDPMFVTKCQQNVVLELDGKAPLVVLRDLYGTLPERDKEIFRHSLFLGIVMLDHQREYRQGDFLIRNLVGIDQDNGALAVGAILRENLVVQFHLRDAKTSAEDLEELLTRYAGSLEGARPEGSLLFSCLGRGSHLYGQPDHDTDLFRRHLGEVPLGGFFCNGEIGDVHGRTYLHGYTSSFGLFRSRARA